MKEKHKAMQENPDQLVNIEEFINFDELKKQIQQLVTRRDRISLFERNE